MENMQKAQLNDTPDINVDLAENELDDILKRSFRPRTDEASATVRRAIGTLAAYANKGQVKVNRDVVLTIESLVAEIDEKLSDQMNLILHHKEFQKLESAWRGLSYLVDNTDANETLKIRVLNISQDELGKTLRRYRGSAWDQSPIFKQVYEHEYGQFGGEPFGCMIGDYEFDHSPQSVALLTELAKVAAAAHCPFITSSSPSIMQMNNWRELGNPRDIGKIFTTPEYAPWRRLRESNDSRYLVLTLPRFFRVCRMVPKIILLMILLLKKWLALMPVRISPGRMRPMPWASILTGPSMNMVGVQGSAVLSRGGP